MTSKRTLSRLSWSVIVAAIALGGALFIRGVSRLRPPEYVTDLDSFLLHMPRPERCYELSTDDARFIELVGSLNAYLLPSGPPAYVFDESRQLVAWTTDQGDEPSFVSHWHSMRRRELSQEEMDALLRAPGGGPKLKPLSD